MIRHGKVLALLALPLLAVPTPLVPVSAVTSGTTPASCAAPTITGTEDDDVLTGTDGPDVIDGRGGDDEIAGAAPPTEEYLFRPELVVRGSTAACPTKS